MSWIVDVVDFLRLPGAKGFRHIHGDVGMDGRRDLLREYGGIAGQIKCLCGENTSSLVIGMVFAGGEIREPRENDRRSRDANDSDQLVQTASMAAVLERGQNILTGCVVTIEKPDIRDA